MLKSRREIFEIIPLWRDITYFSWKKERSKFISHTYTGNFGILLPRFWRNGREFFVFPHCVSHSVEIYTFFCLTDFTWNQLWSFFKSLEMVILISELVNCLCAWYVNLREAIYHLTHFLVNSKNDFYVKSISRALEFKKCFFCTFRASENPGIFKCKNGMTFCKHQNWFHVKSELTKYSEIFTLCN